MILFTRTRANLKRFFFDTMGDVSPLVGMEVSVCFW
jgi:hypothetical protein